jgi:serine/threonine protein kinase
MQSLRGKDIGRYHIIEQLGEGGMAVVYKAFDTRLERDVAIKFIRKESVSPELLERLLKRFEREAMSLGKLVQANIVPALDYGNYEGVPYIVMAFLPGGTLKDKTGRPMPYQEAAALLAPVARALEYAHRRNVIHRDVKPANILITEDGEPMLTDFGIAKILEIDQSTQITATGTSTGTPEYMAPEQWQGEAVPQSDMYALGVIFYELVTARKPYIADTPAAIAIKQATDPLPRPRQFVPGLPDQVEQVIFKVLAINPAERFENMGIFARVLEKLENTTDDAGILPSVATYEELEITSAAEGSPPGSSIGPQKEGGGETETAALESKTQTSPWNALVYAVVGSLVTVFLVGVILFLVLGRNGGAEDGVSERTTTASAEALSPIDTGTLAPPVILASTEIPQEEQEAVLFPSQSATPTQTEIPIFTLTHTQTLTITPTFTPSKTRTSTATQTRTATRTSTPVPAQERVILTRCRCIEVINANDTVIIRMRWIAANADLAESGADYIGYELYADNELIQGVDRYRQPAVFAPSLYGVPDGWGVYWDVPLGTLAPGEYVIKSQAVLSKAVYDGWDTYQPGRLGFNKVTVRVTQ